MRPQATANYDGKYFIDEQSLVLPEKITTNRCNPSEFEMCPKEYNKNKGSYKLFSEEPRQNSSARGGESKQSEPLKQRHQVAR